MTHRRNHRDVRPRNSARYERALAEIAFKHEVTPRALRTAIDTWTAKVQADPKSSPYDVALAEYKAHHFDQAATHVALAYDHAMQNRQHATDAAIKAASPGR